MRQCGGKQTIDYEWIALTIPTWLQLQLLSKYRMNHWKLTNHKGTRGHALVFNSSRLRRRAFVFCQLQCVLLGCHHAHSTDDFHCCGCYRCCCLFGVEPPLITVVFYGGVALELYTTACLVAAKEVEAPSFTLLFAFLRTMIPC